MQNLGQMNINILGLLQQDFYLAAHYVKQTLVVEIRMISAGAS
jgi:hypothetical protein